MSNGTETGYQESLATWAAPYVTEMLGKGQALASTPYQAYTGALTAGPSGLQTQGFQGLGGLGIPAASAAGSFTGAAYEPGTGVGYTTSPTNVVQQYMNPYIEASLQPQIEAMARENQIAKNAMRGQYGKAGAFGGGRQAVAEAELDRGYLDRAAAITGQGYKDAYDRASDLFGEERRYGLDALAAQLEAGEQQRAITQEGVLADIDQFEKQRDYPYKQVQYMQSLLQGLPIEAMDREIMEQDETSKWLSDLGLAAYAFDLLGSGYEAITKKNQGSTGSDPNG